MTTCQRCDEQRWPFKPPPGPYVCQRCRDVLRGLGNVIDPLKVRSEAQQESSRKNLVRGNRPQKPSGASR